MKHCKEGGVLLCVDILKAEKEVTQSIVFTKPTGLSIANVNKETPYKPIDGLHLENIT